MGNCGAGHLGGTLLLPLIALAATAAPLDAQSLPSRRWLPSGADTLDAAAHFDAGMARETRARDAHDAFLWAQYLDPTRPEYAWARAQALWQRQDRRWRLWYVAGNRRIQESEASRRIDSLIEWVLMRDPFPALPIQYCIIIPEVRRMRDPLERGTLEMDLGCYNEAADLYGMALEQHPELLGVRVERARALVLTDRPTIAARELAIVIDSLRLRAERRLRYDYESLEYIEYALGTAWLRAGNLREAEAAFGRALTENLGFWPAHVGLATLAARRDRLFTAIAEYRAAVETAPDDPALRYRLGVLLLRADSVEAAAEHLAAGATLAPGFAEVRFHLGSALDRAGHPAEARDAYQAFLRMAPARLRPQIAAATERLAALEGT